MDASHIRNSRSKSGGRTALPDVRMKPTHDVCPRSNSKHFSRHGSIRRSRRVALPPLFRLYLVTALLLSIPESSRSQNQSADLVVINANIRTIVAERSRAEAMAVRGSRIVAVGTNKRVRRMIGPATKVLDARGRLVLPGFNDSHVHFIGIGNSFSSIDLRYATSLDDAANRIARYAQFLPKGRWILGGGWNNIAWDRRRIDEITPDNPVFVYSTDAKSAFANSRAFQLAKLKENRADIDRNPQGEPTGVVHDDALALINAARPANHTRNFFEVAETATNYAASLGVTSVQDMHFDDQRATYLELERRGKLKTRIYDCIGLTDRKKLETSTDDAMVRGGCLKGFSDGDEDAAPALFREIAEADKAGRQVMIHAIGNSAIDIVLDAFEEVSKLNGKRDRRLRVEHAHRPRPEDLPRFWRSNIVASMQPHLFDGASGGYYRTLIRHRVPVAFGSDASIIDLDPLLGIQSAVTAGTESVSVYDAVRAYTVESAYAEFQEKEKGTLEPGKLADFVILSDDIWTVEPVKIHDVRIVTTVVDGRIVFHPVTE